MLAVIPCGGLGERWGGYYKDLLPIENKQWLINNAIETAASKFNCNKALLVTNKEKIVSHAQHLSTHKPSIPVGYTLTYGIADMWKGIQPALHLYPNEDMLLIMPDTLFDTDEHKDITAPLAFGTFKTNQPERFSVISKTAYEDTFITTKSKSLQRIADTTGKMFDAWGCIYWDREVTAFWREQETDDGAFSSYDAAFNLAALYFGFATFSIRNYQDFASFEQYKDYIQSL